MRANLRSARKAAGLTQAQVAERLGISERQYQRMETGKADGGYRHWDALEDLLGVHQRVLREMQDTDPSPEENQLGH